MAYVLIPEGFSLQKVTKAEQTAVEEYFGRERKGSYLEGFVSNPNAPLVIGGLVAGFFGVKLAEDIIKDIESRVGTLSEDVKQGIKDTVDIKLPTFGQPAPTAPTISDLFDFIKREVT